MRSGSSHASSVTSRSPRTRCRTPSRPRSSGGRGTACLARPAPGSWRPPGTARSTGSGARRRSHARPSFLARLEDVPADEDADVSSIPDERLRAPLHVLSPRARGRRADRPDPPRGRRTSDAGDRPRVPRHGAGTRAAARSREAATSRDGNPVPGAARPPALRTASPTCSACSTSSSTRGTPPPPASRSSAATSARRRSASRSSSAC